MVRIEVGLHGESLLNNKGYIVLESKIPANMPAGIHEICGGNIQRAPISPTHFALYCDKCGLRLTAPNEMETYEQLKKFCLHLGGKQ